MDKILDSADRPLDGEGWWQHSEEPWQTLACCMEIANAMRSPNPEGTSLFENQTKIGFSLSQSCMQVKGTDDGISMSVRVNNNLHEGYNGISY